MAAREPAPPGSSNTGAGNEATSATGSASDARGSDPLRFHLHIVEVVGVHARNLVGQLSCFDNVVEAHRFDKLQCGSAILHVGVPREDNQAAFTCWVNADVRVSLSKADDCAVKYIVTAFHRGEYISLV